MKPFRATKPAAGFTLVELLIGVSLSLIVMGAVLSSYVFLARNFTRSLGLSAANQPTLEAQGRRAVAYFTQDVRMATGRTGTLSASEVTLVLPTSSGSKQVTYYYSANSDPDNLETIYGVTVQPNSLTRIDRNTSTGLTLHTNLISCVFNYYDNSGRPYITYVNYLSGIKEINLSLSAQSGSSTNGTLTPIFKVDSSTLVLRNTPLLN